MYSAVNGGGPEPPPIPKEAPAAPRRGLSKTATVLIAVASIVLVGAFLWVLLVFLPLHARQQRWDCMRNLEQLAASHLGASMKDPDRARRWSGPALWLSMRGAEVRCGGEKVFLCPCDPLAAPPDPAAYDVMDLAAPSRALCSYAGRDYAAFPLDPKSTQPQPIGACVHHADFVIVAFFEGGVRLVSRAELGLRPGENVTVGPDSKSPLLRPLVGGN